MGLGKTPEAFNQYQKHHITDITHMRVYDITMFNIISFANLCMGNNPNMLDALFTPHRCVLHITQVGKHLRDNRKFFLSKKAWHTFCGYAFSQLNKAEGKALKQYVAYCQAHDFDPYTLSTEQLAASSIPQAMIDRGIKLLATVQQTGGTISKRLPLVIEHGFDTKFSSHVVRLLLEVRQILEEHDLDIEANSDILKAIRRGDWSLERIKQYFSDQSKNMEELYAKSTLRYSCDIAEIRKIVLECLELHYGSLRDAVSSVKEVPQLVSDIEQVLQRYRG